MRSPDGASVEVGRRDPRVRHGRRLDGLRSRLRLLRRAHQAWRGRRRLRRDPRAVQRAVELAPEDRAIRRKRWHVLVDLIAERCPAQGAVVAEIGTRDGRTAAHLHKYCPQVARILAVDLAAPDPASDRTRGLERVQLVIGPSERCAERFPDESLDLIFIDADHAESAMGRDLEAWMPKLKPGGVASGHDYGSRRHAGVKRAVDRYFAGHPEPVRLEADKVWWTLKCAPARGGG